MMKRLAGLLAGAALVGGLALAQQDSTPATGGIGSKQGQTMTAPSQPAAPSTVPGQATGQIGFDTSAQGNQLIGTVVESKSHTLYLQHMGAVVPLRVDKNTDLAGLSGKKLGDLKSGDEVQVSFLVKNKIDNVATRIGLPAGTGGSGFGTSEQGRNSGIGGSGSAGATSPGEDTNVGKPVYPEEQPMKQPMDPGRTHGTDEEKPLY